LRETLQEVVQRRRKVQEIQAQAANLDNEVKAIDQDQDRIRKNMNALDKLSTLYKRYVTELDAQETRIQNLRKDASRLRNDATVADRELRAFVDGITIAE
jgi:predicted  nucleic acid-binding Zn-ribbon protein